MTSQTVYLITGANRGLGNGYIRVLLQRPFTTVIAGVRDVSHPTSRALVNLPTAEGSKLIVVPLDSSKDTSAHDAVKSLQTEHSVKYLDVVIANAGISKGGGLIRHTTIENIKEHFHINSIAPVVLFQATADLLKASPSGAPKFIAISSLLGSLGFMDIIAGSPYPATQSPYGASKAALNWFVRRLNFEEPWLTSIVIHPGLVATDMGNVVLESTGINAADLGAIDVETSVTNTMNTIDGASKEHSGTFKNYDDSPLPW